jgi:hypothetical protein
MVRQELYGLFLAHYAIRSFMTEAADTVDIDPDRIYSPVPCTSSAAGSPTRRDFPPSTRRTLHNRDLAEATERINKRRPRTYPRVSKKGNRRTFPTKAPHHQQQNYQPTVIIGRPQLAKPQLA